MWVIQSQNEDTKLIKQCHVLQQKSLLLFCFKNFNVEREAISSDFLKFTTDKEICNSIDFLNNESINNRVTFYINPLTP